LFKFLADIKNAEKGFIAKAISLIMDKGYEDYLKLNFENYKDRVEDLDQFVNFVVNYDSLDKLLSDVMLSERFATDNEQKDNVVVLSTIHQAKGLEWKYVMIIGLRDGDFPHYKSLDDQNQIEEERRLFYVAVTRARDELSMLYPVRKFSYQYGETTAGPSMFLRELDDRRYILVGGKDFVEYDDGEEVIRYD
jgi:DNA helicase-2/ATP-dependent DNA helicase PcrA